jgi:hypothetical protein
MGASRFDLVSGATVPAPTVELSPAARDELAAAMKLTARILKEHDNPDRPCVGLWFHNPVATPDAIITLSSLYNARTRKHLADTLVVNLDGLELDVKDVG